MLSGRYRSIREYFAYASSFALFHIVAYLAYFAYFVWRMGQRNVAALPAKLAAMGDITGE
jgi:hypothetical protein